MLRIALTVASLLALFALTACASKNTNTTPEPRTLAPSDILGKWNLTHVENAPVKVGQNLRSPPGIEFAADNRFSGFAGVNRISGSYDASQIASGAFTFGPAISTKMAGPPELMKLEDSFLKSLTNVTSARMDHDELVLGGTGGDLLRFARAK